MKITNVTKVFGAMSVFFSAGYFIAMNWDINASNAAAAGKTLMAEHSRSGAEMILFALIVGLLWFISSLLLFQKDDKRGQRISLALIYHVIAAIAVVIASVVAYFVSNRNFRASDIGCAVGISIISLIVHVALQQNRLKGIHKSVAFK
jgi:hypothetical protein